MLRTKLQTPRHAPRIKNGTRRHATKQAALLAAQTVKRK